MVVRLTDGREAIRAYIENQANQGLAHVVMLVSNDTDSIIAAVEGLSEDQGTRVTLTGEWTPAEVLAHLNSSLSRSLSRLQAMSSGREWVNPPAARGQGSEPQKSFGALREEYAAGMQSIVDVLAAADAGRGIELTADHVEYGRFNWLQWAVYSHHVHTSDHIAQLQAARARVTGS